MSDDDPNPRASSGLTGANRDLRSTMRRLLREQGIELDPPAPPKPPTPESTPSSHLTELGLKALREKADRELRDQVRAVLVSRGATEDELAWMVPSCPSIDHARTWVPSTPRDPSHVDEAPEPVEAPVEPTPPPQRGWPKTIR